MLDKTKGYPRFVSAETLSQETQVENPQEHEKVNALACLEQIPQQIPELSRREHTLVDLVEEVDLEFQLQGHLVQQGQVVVVEDDFQILGEEGHKAKPSSPFPINEKDLKEISAQVHQRIFQIEQQMATSKQEIFESSHTENLQGEFEKDISKYDDRPQLKELLVKYKKVFGPLPPPGSGCKLAELDLEIKDEFQRKAIRQKGWPVPEADVLEIENQVQELVDAGLIEPFPVGSFPKHCPPTFLVEKKETKTRRMVGHYVKLNKMTKPHAGYLPNMEELVESLAKCRYKTKMDLRSGFWQIGLTKRAQELSVFTTPNGRCFRWLCMPSGLQGASSRCFKR